uniref:Putative secreted protein n=1 Tax=Anopheles darlingi TaxID=43151 RepID=A0A2M4D987_ANODA
MGAIVSTLLITFLARSGSGLDVARRSRTVPKRCATCAVTSSRKDTQPVHRSVVLSMDSNRPNLWRSSLHGPVQILTGTALRVRCPRSLTPLR